MHSRCDKNLLVAKMTSIKNKRRKWYRRWLKDPFNILHKRHFMYNPFVSMFVNVPVELAPAGSGVVRIDPLRFLAGCRKRWLNQVLSVLSLSLGFFWRMCCAVNYGVFLGCVISMLFVCSVAWLLLLGCQYQCKYGLERFISEMTYNMLMGTLNPTHSLTSVELTDCLYSPTLSADKIGPRN